MPALDDDLSNFARAIVQGAEPSPRIDAGAHYSAAVAIGIYRNNYRGNLHDALACAYPVVERLVGRDFSGASRANISADTDRKAATCTIAAPGWRSFRRHSNPRRISFVCRMRHRRVTLNSICRPCWRVCWRKTF